MPPQGGRKHPAQEFLQVNTKNILFICGGAFDGLERIVSKRVFSSSIGFGADITTEKERNDNIFRLVEPHDFVKYGLVPELVGRLPIIATLDELSEEALIRILTQPKNALVKQYRKLLSFDNVELEIDEEALREIAKKSISQKTGARGLRAILDKLLVDIMFNVPGANVKTVRVTAENVLKGTPPRLIRSAA